MTGSCVSFFLPLISRPWQMFRSLLCGSGYGKEDGEQDDEPQKSKSRPSTTRPTRQRKQLFRRCRKDRKVENPYSGTGLDKFSSLVADLEEKREKISSEHRGVTLVRFVYSSSDDLMPVVVKAKSRSNRAEKKRDNCIRDKQVILTESSVESSGAKEDVKEVKEAKTAPDKRRFSFNDEKPSYYTTAVVILILIILAFFGRTVAILCSSAAWYAVPALRIKKSSTKKYSF